MGIYWPLTPAMFSYVRLRKRLATTRMEIRPTADAGESLGMRRIGRSVSQALLPHLGHPRERLTVCTMIKEGEFKRLFQQIMVQRMLPRTPTATFTTVGTSLRFLTETTLCSIRFSGDL